MPRFAKLPSAAKIRNGDDSALIEPKAVRDVEFWSQADPVPAVAGQDGRIVAVEPEASPANNIQWDLRAILRFDGLPIGIHIAETDGRRAGENSRVNSLSVAGRIVHRPNVWVGVR